MSQLARELEGAREQVSVGWTEKRAREVYVAMLGRRRRRRLAAAVASLALVAGLALTVGMAVRRAGGGSQVASNTVSPGDQSTALRLDDGSTVTPRDGASSVVLAAIEDDRTRVELEAGGARLAVAGNSGRVIRLEADQVSVETSRGVVDVAHEGQSIHVSVVQGRALVLWGLEQTLLQEGQSGDFPVPTSTSAGPVDSAAATATPPPSQLVVPPPSLSSVSASPPAAARWRVQAQDGDYDGAFRALQSAGPTAVRDEAGDLLLVADVARLSKHPAEAVVPLQRVLRDHASDPRAPLAAFTLGRVLLDELGRPADAANAFAQARTLAPGGPLDEDALAREVEAWSRAGDASRARAAADAYVGRYPEGRRIKAVRKFGGIE